jgi:hypothetical protein
MSSPCSRRSAEVTVNHALLRDALKWALPAGIFAACRTGVNVSWKARILTYAAVLWAWSDEGTLGKRFITARKLVIKMFRWQEEPGGSYQGFIKALHKWKGKLFAIILPRLRDLMQQCGGEYWTVAGWVLFGVDGSRVQTPRTKANEGRFHATKKKKKQKRARKGKAPQLTKKASRQANNQAKASREEVGGQEVQESVGRPPDLVDAVLARWAGAALGLENGCRRFKRTGTYAGNVGSFTGKLDDCGRSGLCRIR